MNMPAAVRAYEKLQEGEDVETGEPDVNEADLETADAENTEPEEDVFSESDDAEVDAETEVDTDEDTDEDESNQLEMFIEELNGNGESE